eukprot:GGOE01061695.1.p1 GENE.GGOE01061695.1~~GGOE01061695.1.p1  ORF type:complete len:420 (-),score=69.30 GGOE01061695.1:66-1325(-)
MTWSNNLFVYLCSITTFVLLLAFALNTFHSTTQIPIPIASRLPQMLDNHNEALMREGTVVNTQVASQGAHQGSDGNLGGLQKDDVSRTILQRVVEVLPATCVQLLARSQVEARCHDVDRLMNCHGLYAYSKYAWALRCDYIRDHGSNTSVRWNNTVVVKVRKALQSVQNFQLEASIMCELTALRKLGLLETLNGIEDYLVCPSLQHGQDLHRATLQLRKTTKKQRIQKEPIQWGAFIVSPLADHLHGDVVPLTLLFEVVYTVLAIPLLLHIDPMDVGFKHWHVQTWAIHRQYSVDGASCVLPPGTGLSLIDYGVYQCHNQSDRSTTTQLMYHLHLKEIKVPPTGRPLLALLQSPSFLGIQSNRQALQFLIQQCVSLKLFPAQPPPRVPVRSFGIPNATFVQQLRSTMSRYPCHSSRIGS